MNPAESGSGYSNMMSYFRQANFQKMRVILSSQTNVWKIILFMKVQFFVKNLQKALNIATSFPMSLLNSFFSLVISLK